jgi:uncharacterized DUF497 family protein
MIEFDPAKDAANIAKHGLSLAKASEMEVLARVEDRRFAERRMRAFGMIEGKMYCLAYVIRNGRVRAISLRRSREKEYRRYVF